MFILRLIDASFKITPVPAIPFKEILSPRPKKLLSAIPTEPNTPVTESIPPPTEIVAVLCSSISIVTSYLSGSSVGSISLVTSLKACVA